MSVTGFGRRTSTHYRDKTKSIYMNCTVCQITAIYCIKYSLVVNLTEVRYLVSRITTARIFRTIVLQYIVTL